MEAFNVTSKITVIVPVNAGYVATFDSEADFDQVVLRVRNDKKFVDFHVTDLGDTVTMRAWQNGKMVQDFRLTNDIRHEKAFQTLLAVYLA